MAQTLLSLANLQTTEYDAAIYAKLAKENPLTQRMRFKTIRGNAFTFTRTDGIAGAGTRAINGELNTKQSTYHRITEPTAILQVSSPIDRAAERSLVDKASYNNEQVLNKLTSLSHEFAYQFLKGDTAVDPNGLDGIEKRLTDPYMILTPSNSGKFTLKDIHKLIMKVPGHAKDKVLLIGHEDYADLMDLLVSSRQLIQTKDAFNNEVLTFNGVEILLMETHTRYNSEGVLENVELLGKNEGVEGTSSIYCINLADEVINGIQDSEAIQIYKYTKAPYNITDVEWMVGFGEFRARGAARLQGIA